MKNNGYIAITVISLAIGWFLFSLHLSFYGGAVIALVVIVWFFVFLKRRQDQVEADFQTRYADKHILMLDKHAVFKAQESRGYSQTQGQGYLILTNDKLTFEMMMLERSVSVPVTSITGVERTRRLKGVGTLWDMIKIDFTDESGQHDAIALHVKEMDAWQRKLGAMINNGKVDEGLKR